MAQQRTYEAVVDKVVDGSNGPYAVAYSDELGYVTFSLNATVWKEEEHPEAGVTVILSKVKLMRAGWRASNGRFFEPSDQQQLLRTKKEQQQ